MTGEGGTLPDDEREIEVMVLHIDDGVDKLAPLLARARCVRLNGQSVRAGRHARDFEDALCPDDCDGRSASELWQESDDELHAMIKGSAMTYVPLSRLRRNLATVIGNSGDSSLAGAFDRPGRGVRNAARSTLTPAAQDAVEWARQKLR